MSHLSITIIDDDRELLEMLEAMVRDHFGSEVGVHAFDAPPTLPDLAATQPNIVILDLLIGEHHDGLTFMDAMRRHRRLAEVPILVVTASRRGVERYLDEAPWTNTDIMVKPFSLDHFHEALDGLMSGTPPALEGPTKPIREVGLVQEAAD